MIGFYNIKSSLAEILKGGSLHHSMSNFVVYPPKMIQLVKVGEEINQLDYFFARISKQYIEEVEHKTTALSSMMKRLIIIFLGLIVGVIWCPCICLFFK
ncbi:type II secretion system F family protein [Mucilaginibacter sp. PAMB04168]|uniref:type II secretion system F family protein n=1 Tax=Mucilaginibacter sp. PAMB04168 TaxID=3138567 RepID=UPI0031F6871E